MLATVATQNPGLTSLDLKALRDADKVVFKRRRDGTAFIRCIKEVNRRSPWEDNERVHEIPVRAEVRNARSDVEAFQMLYGRHDEEWQTIASLLRAGDQLELEFWADSHTNGYCEEANLHADSLRLHVRRGEKRLVFLLSVAVCADNLARMIRR